MTSKSVVVLSGGLDSTTLMWHVAAQGYEVYPISFNYGQRHKKELYYAQLQADMLGHEVLARHHVIELGLAGVTDLLEASGSSLVSSTSVPEGHYAENTMKATVVPNRNMMMLSIAAAYSIAIEADQVAFGVHAGDHFIYPDCRPQFFAHAGAAVILGNQGFMSPGWVVNLPFIEQNKNYIAQRAFDLNVDIASTWSCYKGGDIHCGRCGTCVERLEAIASTGNADPTPYADESFWKEAIASHE